MGFPRFLKPIQGIQGAALHQFREELAKSLLVAEAFQTYHPSIYFKHCANLAIYQPECFEVFAQPVLLDKGDPKNFFYFTLWGMFFLCLDI